MGGACRPRGISFFLFFECVCLSLLREMCLTSVGFSVSLLRCLYVLLSTPPSLLFHRCTHEVECLCASAASMASPPSLLERRVWVVVRLPELLRGHHDGVRAR